MGKNGKNDGFAHLCKPLLEALRSFITGAAFIGVHAGLRRAIDAAKALKSVLEDDLLLETGVAIRGRRSGKFISKDTYRRRCYKVKGKCQSLKESMNQFKAKVNNRIAWRWMVMAGLGDPTTSTRSVESWCREFAIAEEEKMPISHTSVSAMRDTFGHILLEMSKQDATRYVQGAPHGFVVVRHLHDEATMRLRSKLPSPAAAPAAPALAAAPTAAPAPLAAPAALAQCPGPRSTHLCLYVSETNTAQPPGKVSLMPSQALFRGLPRDPRSLAMPAKVNPSQGWLDYVAAGRRAAREPDGPSWAANQEYWDRQQRQQQGHCQNCRSDQPSLHQCEDCYGIYCSFCMEYEFRHCTNCKWHRPDPEAGSFEPTSTADAVEQRTTAPLAPLDSESQGG